MRHLQLLILLLSPALVHGQPREASIMISGHAANGRQLARGTSGILAGAAVQADVNNAAFGVGVLAGEGTSSSIRLLQVGIAVYPLSWGRRLVLQPGGYYDLVVPLRSGEADGQAFGGMSFRTILQGRDPGAGDIYLSLDIRLGVGFRKDGMLVPSTFFDQQALLSVHIPLLN